MVDDETLFRTMEVAAETGALVMVHARERRRDRRAREAGARGREHATRLDHALTRPPELEGEATNRAIQLAHVAGAPLYVVHVTCKEAVEPDRAARATLAGTSGARRARSTSSVDYDVPRPSRTSRARSTSTRRPCATSRTRPVLWDAVRTDVLSGDLDRPLRVPLGRPEDARQGRLRDDPERRPRARGPADDDPPLRRERGPDHAEPDGRAALDERGEAVRPLSAQGHDRAGLRRRHRRSSTRRRSTRSPRRRTTRRRTTTSTRGRRSPARRRSCCCAATSSSRTASSSRHRGSVGS